MRGGARDCISRDPKPADVGLAIEVSDSTLADDRKQAVIYARAGIAAYWIININERQIEVYDRPGATGYGRRKDFLPGQTVPLIIAGAHVGDILVDDILP